MAKVGTSKQDRTISFKAAMCKLYKQTKACHYFVGVEEGSPKTWVAIPQ